MFPIISYSLLLLIYIYLAVNDRKKERHDLANAEFFASGAIMAILIDLIFTYLFKN
jgi:hypothetical protein